MWTVMCVKVQGKEIFYISAQFLEKNKGIFFKKKTFSAAVGVIETL